MKIGEVKPNQGFNYVRGHIYQRFHRNDVLMNCILSF